MSTTLRRIGLLVPALDEVSEVDFHHYLPSGVVYYTARVKQEASAKVGSDDNLRTMIDDLDNAARSVALPGPELVVFSCTSASFFKGKGWDLEVGKRMADATGLPALTTSTAVREALEALGASTVFMVTPYPDSVNVAEVQFFRDNGFDIVDHLTFNCAASREIGAITPERIEETVLGRRGDIVKCDVLFISCTGLHSIDTVEALEAELGLPVITSNSSAIWATLRRLGVDTADVPAGRLFGLPAPAAEPRVAANAAQAKRTDARALELEG